jgi:hypothetical protein
MLFEPREGIASSGNGEDGVAMPEIPGIFLRFRLSGCLLGSGVPIGELAAADIDDALAWTA